MINLFQELRRRMVIRVVGIYAVVGWLLAQAAVVLQTSLNFPVWFSGVVVGLTALGLPVAVVLAWAFELTPDGMRPTPDLTQDANAARNNRAWPDYGILAGLALIVSSVLLDPHSQATTPTAIKPWQASVFSSIAVLPFVDMSEAGDQEYFGDGIAEEILNVLSRSPDLDVIGRTSSFQFKRKTMDVRAIGEALDVENVVEGSVRRDGQRIRITAQLVRTSDGVSIWAETYDRDVTDVFQVQDEIANAIAVQLQASLEVDEATLVRNRSSNAAAYESFLKGNAGFAARGDRLLEAIASYEKAVALDPNFAAAWANLAVAYSTLPRWLDVYKPGQTGSVSGAAKAEYAAGNAIALAPGLAASQHALGVTLRSRWQWDRSEAAFVKALSIEPNSPEILEDYVELLGLLGRWDDAEKLARRLVAIDSLTGIYQFRLAVAEWNVGEYEAAIGAFKRLRTVAAKTSGNTFVELIDLLAEARGIEAASRFLNNCTNCRERYPGIARKLLETAKASASAAPVTAPAVLSEIEGADYLQVLIGGEDTLLNSLERMAASGNASAIAKNTRSIAMVRDTPRYKQLVKDVNLDQYWRQHGWPAFCRSLGTTDFICGEET